MYYKICEHEVVEKLYWECGLEQSDEDAAHTHTHHQISSSLSITHVYIHTSPSTTNKRNCWPPEFLQSELIFATRELATLSKGELLLAKNCRKSTSLNQNFWTSRMLIYVVSFEFPIKWSVSVAEKLPQLHSYENEFEWTFTHRKFELHSKAK